MGLKESTMEVSPVKAINLQPSLSVTVSDELDTEDDNYYSSAILHKTTLTPVDDRLRVKLPKFLRDHKLRPEDMFWDEKRKTMPHIRIVNILDEYAIGASGDYPSVEALVDRLTNLTEDEIENHRVIFRWLCHHISVSENELPEGESEEKQILETRKTDSRGFAKLHVYLCRVAGLKCERISGILRTSEDLVRTFRPPLISNHDWTKIQVQEKSFLCDAYLATMKSVYSLRGWNDSERKKFWSEFYFMGDPRAFATDHLPLDSKGNIDSTDLYLARPMTSVHEWNREAIKGPYYFGLRLHTFPHEAVVQAPNNEAVIRLMIPYAATVDCTLTDISSKTRYSDHTLVYFDSDLMHILVRLPKSGDYLLETTIRPGVVDYSIFFEEKRLLSYIIQGRAKTRHRSFPDSSSGPWREFYELGLWLVQPECSIVTPDESGRCQVILKMNRKLDLYAEIAKWDTTFDFCSGRCEAEIRRDGERAICDISVSKKGRYSVDIYALPEPGEFTTFSSDVYVGTWIVQWE